MGMSTVVLKDTLLYHFTAETVQTRPAAWQISLHTENPGLSGADFEVSDAGYARVTPVFLLDETNPDEPFIYNSTLLSFPAAVSGYTARYMVIWNDTVDTPIVIERLAADKVIGVGVQAQFAIGEIKIGGEV